MSNKKFRRYPGRCWIPGNYLKRESTAGNKLLNTPLGREREQRLTKKCNTHRILRCHFSRAVINALFNCSFVAMGLNLFDLRALLFVVSSLKSRPVFLAARWRRPFPFVGGRKRLSDQLHIQKSVVIRLLYKVYFFYLFPRGCRDEVCLLRRPRFYPLAPIQSNEKRTQLDSARPAHIQLSSGKLDPPCSSLGRWSPATCSTTTSLVWSRWSKCFQWTWITFNSHGPPAFIGKASRASFPTWTSKEPDWGTSWGSDAVSPYREFREQSVRTCISPGERLSNRHRLTNYEPCARISERTDEASRV